MKQMTCPAMGGPATCTAVLAGNTAEEMVANGTKHVMESHPEIACGYGKDDAGRYGKVERGIQDKVRRIAGSGSGIMIKKRLKNF